MAFLSRRLSLPLDLQVLLPANSLARSLASLAPSLGRCPPDTFVNKARRIHRATFEFTPQKIIKETKNSAIHLSFPLSSNIQFRNKLQKAFFQFAILPLTYYSSPIQLAIPVRVASLAFLGVPPAPIGWGGTT